MTKTVEEKERVVIRFAGDSGDGMQLTGDRFTSATAVLGNDLATLPGLPGRDPGPRRHRARRLGLPDPVRLDRHHHAGRPRRRAGGDEPRGPEGRPATRWSSGGVLILNEDAFTQRNLEKAGYATDPDDRRNARGLPGLPGADDLDHGARHRGPRHRQEGGRAREEHVRAGARVVDVRPPHRDHAQLARAQVRRQAGDLRRERGGVQGRLQLRRDHRAVRALLPW